MAEEKRERESVREKTNKNERMNENLFSIFVESFSGELSILRKVFFYLRFVVSVRRKTSYVFDNKIVYSVFIFLFISRFLRCLQADSIQLQERKSSLFFASATQRRLSVIHPSL